jgi:hypothetical protein
LLAAKGRNPATTAAPGRWADASPVKAERNSFETTCPAETPYRRANSLVAVNTSSSMSSVVRMNRLNPIVS